MRGGSCALGAGDRRRRHVHRYRRLRHGERPAGKPQGADHARRPRARRHGRHRPAAGRERDCPRRHRPRGARHHALHQRPDRAQGRADRAHHHQGLPRHAGDRARAQVRALRHQDRQAGAAGAAPLAAGGAGADGRRRQRAHAARRGAPCWRRAARLAAEGVTSLAIVFLHSYANPRHERQARRAHRRALSADLTLSASHRRGAGDPRVRARLHHGHQRLHQAAGRALPRLARRRDRRRAASRRRCCSCCRTAASPTSRRPSARPCSCWNRARPPARWSPPTSAPRDGGAHVLAFDMGGTTAKLSVVDDGKPTVAYSFEVARERRFIEGSGLPVRISTLELIEIGAGGGSIAHLDDIGLLKVGPAQRRLRARPRRLWPRRQGAHRHRRRLHARLSQPRLLRRRQHGHRHGGRRGRHAAAGRARRPRRSPALAWGIHDLVNENMASAARVHIAEHGKDPRRYALLAHRRRRPRARLLRREEARARPADRAARRRRRLGARPADGAGPRRPRGDGCARDGPDRVARAGGDLRAARGRCQGGAGRDAARSRRGRDRAARRHPLRRPGLRAGRAAPRRPLHGGLARPR